ncbi:anti-repressor SinI family protein [Neobacillus cucumis]|nr:DNA-binding anti-repressor SinI [Neobacillus cucumis]MCM3729884.1 anti-repressor SinI family protein [Neobacillus cucumis]
MKISEQELPKEWVELVKDAMISNVSKEKFKKFLKDEKKIRENKN